MVLIVFSFTGFEGTHRLSLWRGRPEAELGRSGLARRIQGKVPQAQGQEKGPHRDGGGGRKVKAENIELIVIMALATQIRGWREHRNRLGTAVLKVPRLFSYIQI